MVVTDKTLQRVHAMTFSSVYPMYIQKAEKKGRTKDEVDEIIFWLTGYNKSGLKSAISKELTFTEFFKKAPKFNPNAKKITGVICGYRVEDIKDDIYQKMRYLDKLIDELASGKKMESILRQ